MMSRTTPADEVRAQLAALLPRLRRFARVIARNVADADDLVQVSVEKALVRAEMEDGALGVGAELPRKEERAAGLGRCDPRVVSVAGWAR